ncbi:hypothetical protein CVT25_005265 [Psilocybe cyanescens]|uniref:WAP domain-containing protein n=1 Tax=Psilocybe cyanescens TaxID=93625 RepID=A0A409WWY7_PSICY|nr:hypothetical protein CVT25_005265 [Psilocybe cyanescens]
MKLFIITLLASLAFFSQAEATPASNSLEARHCPTFHCGGPKNLQCGGPDNAKCPTGYRCCVGPLGPIDHPRPGSCLPGLTGVCPL